MNDEPRLTAMSTEDLGRYLADSALEMANAQLKLNAALDELSRRVDTLTDLSD
ncbi:hypothetical protein [Humibacillus xanthopallidus]|uniref:hypothetical protein n=1 Tax=Humibacillus xanthopallidus TaxID=412689 RepID=UPI00384E6291